MPRCPHCAHEFAISQDFRCPVCLRDVREPVKPAHLAVLDAPSSPATTGGGPAGEPKGWMERLEAARKIASGRPNSEARPPAVELPIGRGAREFPAHEPLPSKPAHLLVAQLEREETLRQRREADRIQTLFEEAAPEEAIAKVEVEPPKLATRRRLPDWAWGVLVAALVVGGLGYAYTRVEREPKPVAEVDPEVVAAAERKKRALTALQRGHEAVLEQKHDAAIAYYRQALSLEPDLASAERGLGIAYAAKGHRSAAIKHYRRFIELEPDGLEAAKIEALIDEYERMRRR